MVMSKIIPLCILALMFLNFHTAKGDQNPLNPPTPAQTAAPIKPFTGKITHNNVRMRLQANTDCPIIKELNHHDLVIVTGENDVFYAVQPSKEFKGYVFRKYILDGVIEGNHVNIRLEPNTDAQIIGQLNTGDRVEGQISVLNSKWMEITLPENINFFVCKEYVENIGDPSVMSVVLQREEKVDELMLNYKEFAGSEMQKPFEEIQFQKVASNFQEIINNYNDFPDYTSQAKELLDEAQETYLHKKLAYLELKTSELNNKIAITQTDSHADVAQVSSPTIPILIDPSLTTENQDMWNSVENSFYQKWSANHPGSNLNDFYTEQKRQSVVIKGILEPYSRSIRNKPGDYILISKTTQMPTAYLYSTMIDLKAYVGQDISLRVIPRPNHNFAFPAYFVISLE
jgi:uncharacterized protein YgiM (DUF1202 family)